MPRRLMNGSGGVMFHVLNRSVRRAKLFENAGDYEAFMRVLSAGVRRFELRLLAFCVMPNHWHLLVWPENDEQLPTFMHWLTLTHASRWLSARDLRGTGSVYQNRYKAFPVQTERYLLTVCRYIERNPVSGHVVSRAEEWRWSSLSCRRRNCHEIELADWPILRPSNWLDLVNGPQDPSERRAIEKSVQRGMPLGGSEWTTEIAGRLGLERTLRARGRPRKETGSLFPC